MIFVNEYTPSYVQGGTIVIPLDANDIFVNNGKFFAAYDRGKMLWSFDKKTVYKEAERAGIGSVSIPGSKENKAITSMINQLDNIREAPTVWNPRIFFKSDQPTIDDHCTVKLPYDPIDIPTPCWDRLMGVLLRDELEYQKLMWILGGTMSGLLGTEPQSKMAVFIGESGTGKSTIFNLVQAMLYSKDLYTSFDADNLSRGGQFAAEMFGKNPLAAFQDDGTLKRIEYSGALNTIITHGMMTINPKGKAQYSITPRTVLWLASNDFISIESTQSGLVRRLLDISLSGNKVPRDEYDYCYREILTKEIPGVVCHAINYYKKCRNQFTNYQAIEAVSKGNDIWTWHDSYQGEFVGRSVQSLWEEYKIFCNDSNGRLPMRKEFVHDLEKWYEIGVKEHQQYILREKASIIKPTELDISWLKLEPWQPPRRGVFDRTCSDCPAQYASGDIPEKPWSEVYGSLSTIDPSKIHYVKVPENHIVIDFDICNPETGEKDLIANMEAASEFPSTYAETSKSGKGLHLHYIYDGDVSKLATLIRPNIEIKVYKGKSALRRKLTLCNDEPIAHLMEGYLPLKEVSNKVVTDHEIKDAEHLINFIKRGILPSKPYGSTIVTVKFIGDKIEEAKKANIEFDISCLKTSLVGFASRSTHNATECIKRVNEYTYIWPEPERSESTTEASGPITMFDVEVKPNWNCVCWKEKGQPCISWSMPTPAQITALLRRKLVGFNNLKYDNYILYAMATGFTAEEIYNLSTTLINDGKLPFDASIIKNISYMDIYDASSKKQSLKKWEGELGIHHEEHETPWDQPIEPGEIFDMLQYCCNDVEATEALWDHLYDTDITARLILAQISGLTPNDTTNNHTRKIIFGDEWNPQGSFNYRDMGDISAIDHKVNDFTCFTADNKPVFPGYTFENGVSRYRDEVIGEGGYVYSEPGVHTNVALLDIASMHPSSIVAENLFGDIYTKRFKDLMGLRIAIKHKDYDTARTLLDGAAAPFLTDDSQASKLSKALKLAINSVYGLTSAKFKNAFRDPRNVDNIVAKRGELFMINLKHEVQERGFVVAHIKTDSIKIPNATPDIINFVMEYGKLYGYNFEHEATYDKMCLIDKAQYIAKHDGKWDATGAAFQDPYIFKTLFSGEKLEPDDMKQTKECKTALYLKDGDDLAFIGKTSSFVPVKSGGRALVRKQEKIVDGGVEVTYPSVTGTKGYSWAEFEYAKRDPHFWKNLDMEFYNDILESAKDTIEKFLEQSSTTMTLDDFRS